MIYTISTLKRKARDAGYSLREGYQKYNHQGWGYCKDRNGDRIRGYEIYDYSIGTVITTDDLNSYPLTLNEAVKMLQELCKEKGIKI